MTQPSRRQLLAAAGLTVAATSARAAAPALRASPPPAAPAVLAHVPVRPSTSLDGTWRYLLDPFDVAGRKPRGRRAFWEDRLETPGGELIEYEWSSSPEIAIPGDWNTADRELTHYEGPAYFHRVVEGPQPNGRRRFLVFEAVSYRAVVWLNGAEIARHEGGFTPFHVEVTDALRLGPNTLVVRADSRHDDETLPARDFDWKNYGGITRSVRLVELPTTFVREAFVRLERGRILADVTLDGAAAGAAVTVAIENGPTLTGRADAEGRATLSAAAPRALRLWSPETPHLHTVRIRAGEDELVERVGFRTIETRGRQILLNGRPRFLKGIAIHEEPIGPNGGRRVDEAAARALLMEAKALGCDFVRLAHYPHGETMVRLCDELGLIVWAEIPVYWEDVSYGSEKTLALARTMASEMILRDRNRCSVGLWSVANETPQTPERLAFLRAVIDQVRTLDSTRLVTAALNKNVDVGGVRDGEARLVVQDPLGEFLDVVAMNQYEGWYSSRTPDQIAGVTFGSVWDKPLIMSEFGADAPAGHRGPREARWTEDYQAWLYDETLKALERSGVFAGVSPWLLKDFRSPRRWHGRFQQGWNRKGVIGPNGERKLAFGVLRRFYERVGV
jgi:beta-glucuronidase